ncbi:MAG: 1-acyl-sn-glycerol-3-phosphate acyltransferase [Bacteroidota bacterium]|nr:1-acyl-sn-glycerol-3-phosphate acyltransferase [Bacteroidota bacterium]
MESSKIDVDKVLKEKSPRVYQFTPTIFLKKLRSIIHQEEFNEILNKLEGKKGLEFIEQGLDLINVSSNTIGFEKLPKNGGVVIVANHPLGGLDGVTLMKEIGKIRRDIKFIVNDILNQFEPFNSLFMPVNKHGSNTRNSLLRLDELYQSDQCIVIFPAGLVSRKQKEKVEDLEWKKSFIAKVKKYNKPIFPVHISGQNSKRFYRTANIRKKMGIKLNIEMLLLADEMFRQRGSTILLTMGKPIMPNSFNKTKSDYEWAQTVKKHIYKLENNPNFEYGEKSN